MTDATAPAKEGGGWSHSISSTLQFDPELQNLDSMDYRTAIAEVVDNGQTGDKIYDALHLRATIKAGADRLHTSNKRDFSPFSPAMEIVKGGGQEGQGN